MLTFVVLLFCFTAFSCENETDDLALENDSFEDILKYDDFIDKSMMIKEFFRHKYVYISAPHGFGKSTNMEMVKAFCEITVNDAGDIVPPHDTKNYLLFKNNNLQIYKDKTFFDSHFGKYPTMWLNFKMLNPSTYGLFVNSFLFMVLREVNRHGYLENSTRLSVKQIKNFETLWFNLRRARLMEPNLKNSLNFLSELLYTHFNGTGCIVFMDEFDSSILQSLGNSDCKISQIVHFIQDFLSIFLKSNKYVTKVLISACLRLSTTILGDVGNIEIMPFLGNHSFKTSFGFTESETDYLFRNMPLHNRAFIDTWYKGYLVNYETKAAVYNVWNVMNCLMRGELNKYWIISNCLGNLTVWFAYDTVNHKVKDVLAGKDVRINYKIKSTVEDLILVQRIATLDKIQFDGKECDMFLQFLTEYGYFTIVKLFKNKIEGFLTAAIAYPNQELKAELSNYIS